MTSILVGLVLAELCCILAMFIHILDRDKRYDVLSDADIETRKALVRQQEETCCATEKADRNSSMVMASMTHIDELRKIIAHDKSEVRESMRQLKGRGFKNKKGPIEHSGPFKRLGKVAGNADSGQTNTGNQPHSERDIQQGTLDGRTCAGMAQRS